MPFAEPTINGVNTKKKCITRDDAPTKYAADLHLQADRFRRQRPAKRKHHVLRRARGDENVQTSIVLEYGSRALNDQAGCWSLNNGQPDLVDSDTRRRRRQPDEQRGGPAAAAGLDPDLTTTARCSAPI